MRKTMSAMLVAAGLLGFAGAAGAAPVPAAALPGIAGEPIATAVQLSPRERRMVRRDRMERRMMHRRIERRMERRAIRREINRDMRRRGY